MLRNKRSLSLSICNYNDEALCNIYDGTIDVDGQATDVFIKTERNGWKELSFKLPSECGNEKNFRLDYLIADYRIRATIGKIVDGSLQETTDWFIISEPKITHEAFSSDYSVTAGHISQILKTKNLGLEFSDEEGNNVGTAAELATTALAKTGWSLGYVYPFVEDDGATVKVRSINVSSKSGAFKIISEICDKFDAKPVYNGDKTVDIVPMNPFSDKDGTIVPEGIIDDKIIELHYDKNTKSISRTLKTENLTTRLYSYGAHGDANLGACSLQNATHKLYTMTVPSAGEYKFVDDNRAAYYFTATSAGTVQWSALDPFSKSYVWTGSEYYNARKEPNGEYTTLTPTSTVEKNWFDSLFDFDYYEKVGLLTEDMKDALVYYQINAPQLTQDITNAYSDFLNAENELSEIAESNTGFLKLNIGGQEIVTIDGQRALKLTISKTDDYPDGVIYRSDYIEARRNYFTWHCAEKLKENGDPVSGIGSVVYIIHDTDPTTWEKTYIRQIDNKVENLIYSKTGTTDPDSITLWLNDSVNINDASFFLCCTNSMSGKLGARESEFESLRETLQSNTKVVTEEHPTYFIWDNDTAPGIVEVQSTYGWYYRSYSDSSTPGELYFCLGMSGDNSWHRALFDYAAPSVTNGYYFFDMRKKKLYSGESGQWKLVEDVGNSGILETGEAWSSKRTAERVAENFSKVVYACLRHDEIYKGLYEKYSYTPTSNMSGNYAIKNDYGYYWVFSTSDIIHPGTEIYLDTSLNIIVNTEDPDNILKPSAKSSDTIDFPSSNILTNVAHVNGDINNSTGVQINSSTMQKYNRITVYPNVTYSYSGLPSGSKLLFEDKNSVYNRCITVSGSGSFTTESKDGYLTLIVSNTNNNNIHVDDYLNVLFVQDKKYNIISSDNIVTSGSKQGLPYLINRFKELSDEAYITCYGEYKTAKDELDSATENLVNTVGDLYREGWLQKEEYVQGDEEKLYKDTIESIVKISKPEPTYNVSFIDLYGSERFDDLYDIEWPDIEADFAAHLVDYDIDENRWAFIDTLNKCYDKPWKTTLEINVDLSLIGQKTFTDVLSYIADVAKQTKANEDLYMRAATLTSTGALAAEKLEGLIRANVTRITGGSSSWHTDSKGNIVFESTDGQSAMMLSGGGWLISSEKDEYGDWDWRTTATGDGITADVIVGGTITGKLIEAGSITTEKINAAVGQELDIGSNKALLLYATEDGFRPAGQLHTKIKNGDLFNELGSRDSYIEIAAKDISDPSNPKDAHVDIYSGGAVNIASGSEMNLRSNSTMNIESNSVMNVKSGSDVNIDAGGSLSVKVGTTTNSGDLTIDAPNFKIKKDTTQIGGYFVNMRGTVTADAGRIGSLTIGGTATQSGDSEYVFIGSTDSMSSTASGVYIGTDGMNVAGKFKFDVSQNKAEIAGWTIDTNKISKGKVGLSSDNTNDNSIAFWAGNSTSLSAPFRVTFGGAVSASNMEITGGSITIKDGNTTNFNVTNKGILTAKGANITGTISAETGSIGGWTIGTNKIYKGTVGMSSDNSSTSNYAFWAGNATPGSANFRVNYNGDLTSNSGSIAGWTINSSNIYKGKVGLSSTNTNDSSIAFWAGNATASNAPFRVTYGGSVNASNLAITGGSISIGNAFNVSSAGAVTASNMSITGGSISIKDSGGTENFKVTNQGALTAKGVNISGGITATSGKIGGWLISGNYLVTDTSVGSQYVGLCSDPNADYAIYAGASVASVAPFYVKRNGEMKITSGKIGGWLISGNYLVTDTSVGSQYVGLCSDPNVDYAIYAGASVASVAPFYVKRNGEMKITSGYIGDPNAHGAHWKIEGGTLYNGVPFTLSRNTISTGLGTYGTDWAFWAGDGRFSVKQSGYIHAENGDIGGWMLGEQWMWGGAHGNCVCLNGPNSPQPDWAMWAGADWPEEVPSTAAGDTGHAPFAVKRDGTVIITALEVYKDPEDPSKGTTRVNLRNIGSNFKTATVGYAAAVARSSASLIYGSLLVSLPRGTYSSQSTYTTTFVARGTAVTITSADIGKTYYKDLHVDYA